MKSAAIVGAVVCLLLAAACGSDSDDGSGQKSGGTIELGDECILTSECKLQAGQEVACRCDGLGPTRCTALLAPGAPCTDPTACPSNTICISHGQGATCEQLIEVGQPCTDKFCVAGATCKEGVCGAAAAAGEACNPFEPRPCANGLYCDFFDDVCVAAHVEGEECGGNDECIDGVCYSTGGPQVCHPKRKEGEACDSSWQCPENYECDNDVCTKPTSPTTC